MQLADRALLDVARDADRAMKKHAAILVHHLQDMLGEEDVDARDLGLGNHRVGGRHDNRLPREDGRPVDARVELGDQLGVGAEALSDQLQRRVIAERFKLRFAQPGGGHGPHVGEIGDGEDILDEDRGGQLEDLLGGAVEVAGFAEALVLLPGFQGGRALESAHAVHRATGKAPAEKLHLRGQPVGDRLGFEGGSCQRRRCVRYRRGRGRGLVRRRGRGVLGPPRRLSRERLRRCGLGACSHGQQAAEKNEAEHDPQRCQSRAK